MSDSAESRIQRALERIQALLGEIAPLREGAESLTAELNRAKALYKEKLLPLVQEGDALRSRILTLQRRRQGRPAKPAVVLEPMTGPSVEPPKEVLPQGSTTPPPAPQKNPRRERKLALAHHISWIMGRSRQESVNKVVNALLADERADIGDMLELIAWGEHGEFWKTRPDWQTPEDQAAQLEGWVLELQQRLAFWRDKLAELDEEAQLDPWPELTTPDLAKRQAFLEERIQKQTEENRELKHETDELEKMIQQASGS